MSWEPDPPPRADSSLERIADALERIADALEESNKLPPIFWTEQKDKQ